MFTDCARAKTGLHISQILLCPRASVQNPGAMSQRTAASIPALPGPRANHQRIRLSRLPAQKMPQNSRHIFRLPSGFLSFLTRFPPPEIDGQKLLTGKKHSLCIKAPREAERPGHPPFPAGERRHSPAGHLRPAHLLHRLRQHRLQHHLLPRQGAAKGEEFLCPLPAQLCQNRPLPDLLLIYTVFKSKPEQIVKFVRPRRPSHPLKKGLHPLRIKPFLYKSDDEVKIKVSRSIREKSHKRRVELISPRRIPDRIERSSLLSPHMPCDHDTPPRRLCPEHIRTRQVRRNPGPDDIRDQ